jgi:hypothetical protein
MAFRFPIRAPIIETIRVKAHPLQIIPHHDVVVQNPGSAIAATINPVLQIMGTYQMLLGFSLTMKKQHVAVTKSNMI